MQNDQSQQDVDQKSVNVARGMRPAVTFFGQRRQGDAQDGNRPAAKIGGGPTQQSHRQDQKIERPMGEHGADALPGRQFGQLGNGMGEAPENRNDDESQHNAAQDNM